MIVILAFVALFLAVRCTLPLLGLMAIIIIVLEYSQ